MKTKVRRRKRLQFPAAGVQSDIETLLQKFVDSKSIRYEEFARLWREGNFSLLCAGRTGLREKREFIEETFKIVLKFVLSPYSLQVRVGALFALYGIYYTQRTKPKIKVRMPLSCWCDVMELHQEVVSHRHLDIDYIIRKMIHEGVFEHVAYPSPLTVEDFYNKDDDDDDDSFVEETEINNTWQKEVNLVSELLDEDSLGQLNAVHSKYHQLKCHLNATRGGDPNQPSTSLDLIQGDVVDTIIRVAQQTEISVTSPHRSKAKSPRAKASAASSEESASERATRIKEIKKRASQARANTDSGSLRYINTSPEHASREHGFSADLPSQGGAKKKVARSSKRRAKLQTTTLDGGDSDALSDEDVIKGVISSIVNKPTPPSSKQIPSRKAKKVAHSKLSRISGGSRDSDDDVILDDDDEYDVEKECADLSSDSRAVKRALKRAKQARTLLDERVGVAMQDSETTTSQFKGVMTTPGRGRPKKIQPPDQPTVSALTSDGGDQNNETPAKERKRRKRNASSTPNKATKMSSSVDEVSRTTPSKKPKTSHLPVSIPTAEESRKIELKQNILVAFKPLPKYVERPLVGKVVTFTKNFVNVIWYLGGYSTAWTEWTDGKGEDRKIQREKLSREMVLMTGFEFTGSHKLPVKVTKELRRMYLQLDKKE